MSPTLVHSCCGILSSFEFRISPFTQVPDSLPDSPGTHRNVSGTQRDPTGSNRDGFWETVAQPQNAGWNVR
jgi:hypothetical protein